VTLDLADLLFLPPTCRAGFVVVHPRGRGAGAADLRPTGAPHPERREVQGVAARRDAHLNNRKEGNRMNADNPSIYDYRDNEIETAQRIRRERIRAIVGGIIAAPFALAALVAWAIVFACL
jgi:hypothetical protein